MPLSRSFPEDKLIWNYEKDGEYSLKCAYHLSRRLTQSDKAGSSSNMEGELWKQLWKAPIQEKTNNFMWRLNNILPTNCNLAKKGIHLDDSYPLCLSHPEMINHLFLYYDFAKCVFFSCPIGVRLPISCGVYEWMEEAFKKKDWNLIQVLCTGLWRI